MNNYLRWVSDYLENCREDRQEDVIQRPRRFMADNYTSPDMTLKSAADCTGSQRKIPKHQIRKKQARGSFSAY
ncbi:MAG: hypothetical protein ACLR0U_08620 [Enterocloster clostridioformis]